MIKPTVGRRVYYKQHYQGDVGGSFDDQPFDAGIIYVWSDTKVNLLVTSHDGEQEAKIAVTLAQDRDPVPGECYWMPYQQAQARG